MRSYTNAEPCAWGVDQWEYTFRTGASATLRGMRAVFPYLRGMHMQP